MNDLDFQVNFGKAAFVSIANAIQRISPGSHFVHRGTDYDGLEWKEPPVWEGGKRKPSREEVQEELKKLEVEWENTNYQKYRALEYPDFKEYLDGIVKGDADQVQAYIQKCLAVKAKYPKPEELDSL